MRAKPAQAQAAQAQAHAQPQPQAQAQGPHNPRLWSFIGSGAPERTRWAPQAKWATSPPCPDGLAHYICGQRL